MISDISAVLDRMASLVPQGVSYSPELLSKFNAKITLDKAVYGHLIQGGEAGGYHHWLTLLARQVGPALIVELGNRYGVSTIALYQGLSADSRLLTVDVVHDQRYVPEKIFQDPRVKFIFADCLDITAYEAAGVDVPLDIDILWTDTLHYYKQLSSEFKVYEPLLADEAIIAIDDIHLNDKGRFFSEAPYEKRDLTALCHGSGFGVLHYVRPLAERGKSRQDRIAESLRRSARIGYENYWDLFRQYESLQNRVQKHPCFRALRKLAAGLKFLFGKRSHNKGEL